MIRGITIPTPELGDRSYLLHDGEVAVVIDPQRDIGRFLAAAADAHVRITCVAETHIHNDYLSGGVALAALLDVPYLVSGAEDVSFRRLAVSDGDEVSIGRHFRLKVIATPGHTLHHVAYVALDDGQPVMVCSGGSLLFGTTGRTDLSGDELAVPLARAQFRSVHRLGDLGPDVALLPTHGFGSFCAPLGGPPPPARSTLGEQRAANLAFRCPDQESFADALLDGLAPFPRYFGRMADLNRVGVTPADVTPPPALDGHQLSRFLAGGGWAVDLRPRAAFAASHIAGTVNIEHGPSFTTSAGSVLPWRRPLVLLAATAQTVLVAQHDLSRIGMDRLTGQAVGPVEGLVGLGEDDSGRHGPRLACYPVVQRTELLAARRHPSTVVLDVRRTDEWERGHLDGAVHVPLMDLEAALDYLPAGRIWVHCAAGYRASIAASLLARVGRQVVLVDGEVAPAERAAAA
jgi:glyoxylase-like metal-dependent hydrolase (beta-lactamase superfamily II)/rhodanese-related sulfurtransferase